MPTSLMVAGQMNNLSDTMLVWQSVFSWNYPQGVCGVWPVFAAVSDFRHRGGAEKHGGLAFRL